MPISKDGSNVINETAPADLAVFTRTGVIKDSDFAVMDRRDPLKQLKVDCSGLATDSDVTLSAVPSGISVPSLRTSGSVGTAATGVTAVEYGDSRTHQTVLTLDTVLPAIAGGASLGVGKLLYTLPAGAHIIESAYMSVAITQTDANITADTPDVGLGTVIASGAVAVLGGTATFENIITGQTAADCDGEATVKTSIPTAGVPLVIEAAGAKTIHLNVADGWAADGDAAALLTGTVVINWRTMA